MATRLVSDELDLNLSALAAALLVIVVIAAGGGAWSFDSPWGVARSTVSGMIVELSG